MSKLLLSVFAITAIVTLSRLDSSTAPLLLTEGFTESRFGFALSSAGDTNNDGWVMFKIVTFILVNSSLIPIDDDVQV